MKTFQPVECRKRIMSNNQKSEFLHTKIWFVELFGALINHCPKAFYYLIKLNWNRAQFLWTVTGFPANYWLHLKYVFENLPLTESRNQTFGTPNWSLVLQKQQYYLLFAASMTLRLQVFTKHAVILVATVTVSDGKGSSLLFSFILRCS